MTLPLAGGGAVTPSKSWWICSGIGTLVLLQKGNRERDQRVANQSTELKPRWVSPVKRLTDESYCALLKKWCSSMLLVWMSPQGCARTPRAVVRHVLTVLLLSCSPRADEIEMIMTDLERANQVGFSVSLLSNSNCDFGFFSFPFGFHDSSFICT